MKTFDIKFSDIDWGEDDAKNDESLEHYFVEFPGYDKILSGKKHYIIGRKGTGKSAILQKVRLQCSASPTHFYTDISLRDFPLTDFKSLGDRSLQDKSKYVSAWKFLLLTEIANLFMQDNSIENTDAYNMLKRFVHDNFPDGISVVHTIGTLRENQNKISLSASLLSGEHSASSSEETSASIHYNKAVKTLENLLSRIETKSTFVLLIDELDEGYHAKGSNLNLVILSLLRSADELYNFFRKNEINCIPILALRSDIFDGLEDNDLNKLDDFVLRLNWTANTQDEWSLRQIVEKRIKATVREKYPTFETTDYWSLVADEASDPRGLFQYICILTFSRPRDIIKMLKYCSESIKAPKLTLRDVRSVEEKYSSWFYQEFRDEVQSFLSCWRQVLNCITEVAKGKEQTSILLERFNANDKIQQWCRENSKTSKDILEVLFDYSVIGCINKEGRWIFKYKDDHFEFMSSYPSYCVHYGFCRKLRIPKSYDQTIIAIYRSYM